jgi:hypothetical protein
MKVGDRVRRTGGEHAGMKKGDYGTIVSVTATGVILAEYNPKTTDKDKDWEHAHASLELVSVTLEAIEKYIKYEIYGKDKV